MISIQQLFRGFTILLLLTITMSGLASAQGDSTTVFFPVIFFAQIAYPRITRVSVASDGTQAIGESQSHSISADGRFVAFESWASNLVNGDTNNSGDVFVHDRQTGETTLVSISLNWGQSYTGAGNPSISADGRYVAFEVAESSFIFVKDRHTGQLIFISSNSWSPSISANGRYVAFASSATDLVSGDTNEDCYLYNNSFVDNCPDVFVYDLESGEIVRVSVASDGTQANGESGRYWYGNPSIRAEGKYVAFWSEASNLVRGDTNQTTDIFIHDRFSGETVRVSVASDGTQGNARSASPSISANGRYVAFSSEASNLVSGDTQLCYYESVNCTDIFVSDRGD